jgi:predicted dehydrogenase
VLADLDAVISAAEAACVAVPTVEHAPVGETLLSAGMDLLIEKPVASTREEARRLIDAARKGERILQVGHVERFSAALRGILPVLQRPRFIEAHRIGPYPARCTDVSVVLDLMIHDLDIVAQLAGSEIDSIDAVGIPVLSSTEDIANARIRFANGCILNITASRVSLEKMRKIRLFQADAYISIDLATNKIVVIRRGGSPGEGGSPEILAENLEFDAADALLAQDRAFVEAVRSRGVPRVTGEDGYRALDLALRIQESIPPPEELM